MSQTTVVASQRWTSRARRRGPIVAAALLAIASLVGVGGPAAAAAPGASPSPAVDSYLSAGDAEPAAVDTGPVVFVAAGDIGQNGPADAVLTSMGEQNADFFLLLGDISYGHAAAGWCEYAQSFFPPEFPIELIAGNHDTPASGGGNANIHNFVGCAPDRMGAVGEYGIEYYLDVGPVRLIMVAADLDIDGEVYAYDVPGPHRDWLLARVDEAEAAGRWTVVAAHKPCVTAGVKSCDIGAAMINDLIDHGVDLILHGHDHNFQRSHQLRCIQTGTTAPECIVDADSSFQAEQGTVIAISGWVGRGGYDVDPSDNEAGYFAVLGGSNNGWDPGYLTITVTNTSLTGSWTSPGADHSDAFTIHRSSTSPPDPCIAGSCDTIYGIGGDGRWWRWGMLNASPAAPFYYGNPGDVGFSGDWDCDGVATPGLYRQSDGFVYLRNSNTQGNADLTYFFGNPGDLPVAGDFDGDGCDTVSLYRPSQGRFFVINELGENGAGLGAAETSYYFGKPGDKPFAGDFDGDGVDTLGLHRESTGFVYFRNSHTQGVADAQFVYGDPGDILLAGDWDGDGDDTVAVYRPGNGHLYVKLTNAQGNGDVDMQIGRFPQIARASGS
jgi:Calcineurin-like phosphoesterase